MRKALVAPTRRGFALVVAVLLTAGVVAACLLLDTRPPRPAPASAPAGEFSAARAKTHLDGFATRPRPLGSEESDHAKSYLAGQLRKGGFDVRVDRGLGGFSAAGTTVVGRVENVVGTLRGTDSTGIVVLAAHYDSVAAGPGASDDGTAVAAILETVRALREGDRPRNDVVVVLTDGEEPGLLGASAFRHQDPLAGRRGVVLNWEARGTTGPSLLFETSAHNADLVRTYAHAAPFRFGDSSSGELYRFLPNNTDFTEFRRAGFTGLNFAYLGGSAYYHSPGDTIAHVDDGSLQNHGANMLALTRAFGHADLAKRRTEGDATFFRLLGQFVTYPNGLALPIALVGLVLLLTTVALARHARLLSVPRVLLGTLTALLPILAASGLAQLLATALVWIRPGYAAILTGDPYRPGWYEVAVAALAVGTLLAWYAMLRRRIGPAALAIGALAWPVLLGLVCALVAPGAAYLFSIPAVAGTVGALVALGLRGFRPSAPAVPVLLASIPTTATLVLLGDGFVDTGFLTNAVVAAGAFTFCGLLLLPLLDWAFPAATDRPTSRRRAVLPPVALALVALVASVAGLGVDRFDDPHPRPTHLAYVLDTRSGKARWVSGDEHADSVPWLRGYVTTRAAAPLPYRDESDAEGWVGRAPRLDVRPPEVRVLSRHGDDLRVHVSSLRHAGTVSLAFDRAVERVDARMDERPRLSLTAKSGSSRTWPARVQVDDLPASGVTLTLRMSGGRRPRVAAFDQTDGLDEVPGFIRRPADLQRSPLQDGDQVIVGRVYSL